MSASTIKHIWYIDDIDSDRLEKYQAYYVYRLNTYLELYITDKNEVVCNVNLDLFHSKQSKKYYPYHMKQAFTTDLYSKSKKTVRIKDITFVRSNKFKKIVSDYDRL